MLLITCIIGLVIIWALFHHFSRAGRLMRKIPGPPVWPIIGNALNYAVSPDKVFPVMRSLPKKYGHISQIHGLHARIVNISNPEDIEKIMSSAVYNNKKMPYTFVAPWLSEGLLVSNGNKWLQRRKMLTKAFHFSILKKFTEIFKTGAQNFLKRVEKETDKDKTDILAFICPTALRVMCDKVFPVMRSLPKKYGHISQIHGLHARIVNISNPEDIEKIMSSAVYNNKKMPYTFVAPWLSEGLLVSNGNKWLQRRKMLTKAFHFSILKKFTEIFKTGAQNFLKRVEKETDKDKTDILAFICPTALRVMCETAMGLTIKEDSPAMKKYFDGIFAIGECFALRTSRFWLHNEFFFSNSSIAKTQKLVIKDLHEFTTKVINERRKMLDDANPKQENSNIEIFETTEKLAMLDLLLENEKLGLITSVGIREEVDTFMFEGFDTTSSTLTYMMLAIANEPKIQDKIYKEMQTIFGDSERMPTAEDVNEMKYLETCIKESMRLYPAAPLIIRHLVNDTELSGYTIPAGTDCFIFIYDIHHREDIYPDAERFDPDRFLPENSQNRNPYAYIPFSAGQRNCIGQKFAMLELKIIMSSLLRKFRLEPVTRPSELTYRFDVVLRTQEPIYVRFRSR
ncbi:cytochrome P450 4C1-like [Maniola jurtina]|uniref:cytochrome P450 4C1-like n=1 Tax=Maniola jurtina TaxID=191418 RepID=UPI001E6898B3|nr:cytochrome P450 4C1-like [Maniola jurtina]